MMQTSAPLSMRGESTPPPPKPSPRRFVIRVEADPLTNEQAVITEKHPDGQRERLVMHVPIDRVRPRFLRGETVVFFIAELDGESGVLEICERAPREKQWKVAPHAPPAPPADPMLGPGSQSQSVDQCPCGATRHMELCRDALAAMHGRRSARYKVAAMTG